MNEARAKRILDKLSEENISQMLIIDPMSIYYLTGVYVAPFERFYGLLIKKNGEHIFFLNNLFHVPEEVGIKKVWYSDTDDITPILMQYIDKNEKLGVDKDIKARHLLPLMENNAATAFVNTSLAVDYTRGIKDEDEKEKMRVASIINDKAIDQFKNLIHEGVTEKEVADQTLAIYKSLGADDYSFEPLIAFGANAADPHHEPDNTVIKEGDCVLFDVGCKKDGYCSDMTRTFFYKKVSDEHRKVYETVRDANIKAEALIKPGIELCNLDKTARDHIAGFGWGEKFNHRLGHFIGLNEHEYGDVSSANKTKAEAGMIFSIEPGIYLENDIGVRVEDLVLVTEDGVELLNKYPKDLIIIG